MGYYVYPVYVLASLIVLILSIICTIYSLHFYKFIKSRIVIIKLESDVALNTWTFDLYPFTSSRIWRVLGYAIVCLPKTFQQSSTILVCQCKVINFKTTLPKGVCDDKKGVVTPVLQKKTFISKPCEKNQLVDEDDNRPVLAKTWYNNCEQPILGIKEENEEIEDEENIYLESTPLNLKYTEKEINSNNITSRSQASGDEIGEEPSLPLNESTTTTALDERHNNSTEKKETTANNKQSCCDNKSRFQRITQRLQKQSRHEPRPDAVVNIDPETTEHNMSIMSIDNSFDADYFIIPEANPLELLQQGQQQTLVLFNEPFNSSCPICLDDFELDEEIALLTCHHGYHKDCLNKALRQNASCPYCKSESNVRAFKVSEEIPLLWQSMSRRNSQAVNA